MSKLSELHDQINQQLNLCDSIETPVVCGMMQSVEGKNKLVELITQKVLYTDNISIADAIVEIENEYSINAG